MTMINDNELRLGNYVYYGESIRQITMLQHSPQRMAIGVDNLITLHERISPIPLSGELLVKCGFVLKNEDDFFPYYRIKHTRINELVEYKFDISTIGDDEWRWIDGNANVPFYYLHQLQNLYFALTNSELPINHIP